jgi:hypothetical protein
MADNSEINLTSFRQIHNRNLLHKYYISGNSSAETEENKKKSQIQTTSNPVQIQIGYLLHA